MTANHLDGADINGAAERISGLLNPEREPTEETQPVQAEEVEASETSQDDTNDEPTYKVKVNGEEREVSLDELMKGYMMESDYRQKTSQVSEKRKAAESRLTELDEKVKEAKALIEIDLEDLESDEAKELREYDPQEYWKRVDKVKSKAERLQKLQEKQQAEHQKLHKERLTKEQEKLLEAIPDWLDEDKKSKDTQRIVKVLEQAGFTSEDMANVTDHRFFVMARKAMLFDEINSQDLDSKKVKSAPKTAKPAAKNVQEVSKETLDARSKLNKSGHLRDAQAYIKTLMR